MPFLQCENLLLVFSRRSFIFSAGPKFPQVNSGTVPKIRISLQYFTYFELILCYDRNETRIGLSYTSYRTSPLVHQITIFGYKIN